MKNEELTYRLDIEKGSLWLRTTPSELARKQPFCCSEAGIFYARKDFRTKRAHKDAWILFYTLKGKGVITQNDTEVELNEKEAVLMNCRIPQSYHTYGDCWDHYWIHINGEGVRAMEEQLIPDGRLTPVKLSVSSVKSCLDPIIRNLENPGSESILEDSYLIHQLLYLMVQESFLRDPVNASKDLILRTSDYIRLHYTESIPLKKLLDLSHMSRSYYMRLFRQYIGTTPYNYLLSLRITKAKELLELTDEPIGEIALKTGFRDHSAFTVRFTAMTGESPQEYRQNAITAKDQKSL